MLQTHYFLFADFFFLFTDDFPLPVTVFGGVSGDRLDSSSSLFVFSVATSSSESLCICTGGLPPSSRITLLYSLLCDREQSIAPSDAYAEDVSAPREADRVLMGDRRSMTSAESRLTFCDGRCGIFGTKSARRVCRVRLPCCVVPPVGVVGVDLPLSGLSFSRLLSLKKKYQNA